MLANVADLSQIRNSLGNVVLDLFKGVVPQRFCFGQAAEIDAPGAIRKDQLLKRSRVNLRKNVADVVENLSGGLVEIMARRIAEHH